MEAGAEKVAAAAMAIKAIATMQVYHRGTTRLNSYHHVSILTGRKGRVQLPSRNGSLAEMI